MINALFRFCFEKRMLFIVVTILVLIFGYYSWTQLAIEAYPELSDVTAQVTTQVPGLAAEEIEQQITTPLERGLAGYAGPRQHAFEQHVRSFADHARVQGRRR